MKHLPRPKAPCYHISAIYVFKRKYAKIFATHAPPVSETRRGGKGGKHFNSRVFILIKILLGNELTLTDKFFT
jgi:hypothetical protein